ncbi:MAG TPA: flagellar basal body P-ring protein FlgI [Candidatus Angelobacter sp.]|nr:flagellar basal body P-ring protein FlgI [Candidatus Angelobacter sp.]
MKKFLKLIASIVFGTLCAVIPAVASDNPGPDKAPAPSPKVNPANAAVTSAPPVMASAATTITGPTMPPNVAPTSSATQVRVKDITTIEGVRENPLIGYGLVVGLSGTGDRQQTVFSTQTLTNILQRMGVQVAGNAIRVNNIAAVFVTANLPPFARPGMQLDVTVASIGDAKSLEGGLLLLTPLAAANGQTYAVAQGPMTLGGYSAGGGGNTKVVNHPTSGRIPGGAIVEKPLAVDLTQLHTLSFLLRSADFATARDLASAVNQAVGKQIAKAVDSRRVEVVPDPNLGSITDLLAQIQETTIAVHSISKVVVNERTGTVVMGKDVQLGAVSILHGTLSIEVKTELAVSQPRSFGTGQTTVVPETTIKTQDSPARRIELKQGATVDDLVRGLQAIGATARDIVAILQAMKEADALHADLEVI